MNLKQSNIRIIQTSHTHTGSTVLVNLLQGYFYFSDPIKFQYRNLLITKNFFVYKTHNTNIENLIKMNPEYDLYFISSARGKRRIESVHPRLLQIEYEELLETSTNTLETIANNVALKVKAFCPIIAQYINIENGILRIQEMNRRYEQIKHLPFNYCDKFYHIHGSHRNRS